MADGEREEADEIIANEWPLSATAIDNEDAAMVTRVRRLSKSCRSGLQKNEEIISLNRVEKNTNAIVHRFVNFYSADLLYISNQFDWSNVT